MSMFLYYASHSFINQIKKLFKTWVLIFFLVCVLIGGIIGGGAAVLFSDDAPSDSQQAGETAISPEEEALDAQKRSDTMELAVGGVVLGMLVMMAVVADKNGSSFFLPADVNILFPSPLKPQSVLMFRVASQLGVLIFASVYMLFQLPGLILTLGLTVWAAIAVVAAWGFTLIFSQLIQVLLYTVSATRGSAKNRIRPTVLLLLLALAAAFMLYWRSGALSLYDAAARFFNAPVTRYIPVWGWIKGFVMFAAAGDTAVSLIYLGLLLAAAGGLILLIWNIKADFYEDAMSRSEETAELMARVQEGSGIVMRRKKDRADSLTRDGLRHGAGASVFFFKAMYNRFRFAYFKVFTKTSITYLFASVITCMVAGNIDQADGLTITALALGVLTFFRSMGNPLSQDTESVYFRMLPESTWKKLLWSMLGGGANCFLDLIPAMAAAVIILRANALPALLWMAFIVSFDLYSTSVGTFIQESVPVSAGKTLKQLVQIMFVYFGLLPDAAVIALGFSDAVALTLPAALAMTAVLNVCLGAVFLALIPLFIDPRSRPYRRAPRALTDQELKGAGKFFSRCGAFALVILAASSAVQIAVMSALNALAPGALQNPWTAWAATFAPIYLAGVPAGLLVIRRLPGSIPAQSSLSAGQLLLCIPIALFLMYAGNIVGTLVTSLIHAVSGASAANPIEAYASDGPLALKIAVMVVIAPLVEEFVFRRQLIDRMRVYGEKTAVIASAVIFGLFHGNLSQLFYAFALGLLLGYLYLRTGRLRYGVILHMTVNFLGSIAAPALMRGADLSWLASAGSAPLSTGTALFLAYIVCLLAAAVAGLVLLCLKSRSVFFDIADMELPKAQRFRTVYLNAGMLLFALGSLALAVSGFLM